MNTHVYSETFHWMGKEIAFGDAVGRLLDEWDAIGWDPIADILCESLLTPLEKEFGIKPEGSLEHRIDEIEYAFDCKDIRQVSDEVLDTEVSLGTEVSLDTEVPLEIKVSIDGNQSITWRELFKLIEEISCWTDAIYEVPAWAVLNGAACQLGLVKEVMEGTPSRGLLYMIIEKLQERQQAEEAE